MRTAVLALLAASCAGPSQVHPAQTREAELARIADKCSLPRSSLRIAADDTLRFQPDPDARYEDVACALAELGNSRLLRELPLGFVGNAGPSGSENVQAD